MALRNSSWHARALSCAKNRPSTKRREWSSTIRNSLARTEASILGNGTHGPTSTSVIHLSLGRSIGRAFIGERAALGEIAILDPVADFLRRTGAHIGGE